jgi:radical SAM superfamily enzyme
MDMTQAVQTAKTASEHEALARHYEDAAKDMRAKANEHKKMLAYYEARKDLINHCQGLIRIYEQAANENLSMAKSHHELAAEAK